MGELNSSVTRVWPVFETLFSKDLTGARWLPQLLNMAEGRGENKWTCEKVGQLLPCVTKCDRKIPGLLKKVLGVGNAARLGHIRRAFEVDLPPPLNLLRWMLENHGKLQWPKGKNDKELVYSEDTERRRRSFMAGDGKMATEGLAELDRVGVKGSRRKWWAFEGFTSADCLLETDKLLVLIEGKRTEEVSHSVSWLKERNQIVRNVEALQQMASGRKDYVVMVCAEKNVAVPNTVWQKSLPHLDAGSQQELRKHFIGSVTWSEIASAPWCSMKLPANITEALEICLACRRS